MVQPRLHRHLILLLLVGVGCGEEPAPQSALFRTEMDLFTCANGRDDDNDGLIDCADPSCAKVASCGGGPVDAGPDGWSLPLDAFVGLDSGAQADVPDAAIAGADAEEDAPLPDAGAPDAGLPDAGPSDASPPDAGLSDAAASDTATLDAGPPDAGPEDTGPPDTGPVDTGPPDTGPVDTGPPDTGPVDTGPPDTGPVDAGPPDTGPVDTGPPDTGPVDTGPPDTGPVDTGPPPLPCPPGSAAVGTGCQMSCPVLIVGGGLGGVAAGLAASAAGVQTCLVQEQAWLGGQATTQGVSALDEGIPANGWPHWSASYRALRDGIRAGYLAKGKVATPKNTTDGSDGPAFNPGACWVSRLCFEPKAAADVLEKMLAPAQSQGTLVRLQGFAPTAVQMSGATVTGVTVHKSGFKALTVQAKVVLDATELGDLLALANLPHRTGAESKAQTGEPHARPSPAPECVQPFTYTFILEKRPSAEVHTIAKPAGYDPKRYKLATNTKTFGFFSDKDGLPFWSYRRVVSASAFTAGSVPYDLAMINWGPDGNDFDTGCWGGTAAGCNAIGKSPAQVGAILAAARAYTLGFVYWLQHDAPRDGGGCCGYPNLKLRTDLFPSADGLSPEPYIRESRRIVAVTTVREQDIVLDGSGPRATLFGDSVGTGWYPMDLHACAAGEATEGDPSWKTQTRPFQVPLGALLPASTDGLLAAAKNIGVTHLTNGAYRLHPVEWHIGEAAGLAAALAVSQGVAPRKLWQDKARLRTLQQALVARKMPLYWWSDLSPSDFATWRGAQLLGVLGVLNGFPDDLTFRPNAATARAWIAAFVARLVGLNEVKTCKPSFSDVPCSHPAYGWVQAIANAGITSGCGGGKFCVDDPVKRDELAVFMVRAAGWPLLKPGQASFSDVAKTDPLWAHVETAKAHGLFADDGLGAAFSPKAAANRTALARWGYRMLKATGAL